MVNLIISYLWGLFLSRTHVNQKFEKKAIHQFILDYWADWFPLMPAYQTFCHRLNQLEQTFQTIGGVWMNLLKQDSLSSNDHLIDSMPIMLAQNGHSFSAKVARDIADKGYCQAKRLTFMAFACIQLQLENINLYQPSGTFSSENVQLTI